MLLSFSSSFKVGRIFGIDVRVHASFLLLMLAVIMFQARQEGGDVLGSVAYLLVLFVIVLLHELGHSLVARHYGVRVLDITFWPLGGMARLEAMPENPKIELWIALAGPLVNFALAALAAPVAIGGWVLRDDGHVLLQALWPPFAIFCGINLMLGIFNLLPAFPMDGGRVLRALIGFGTDWLTATRSAVAIGRGFALLMLFGAFVLLFISPINAVFLVLIAMFVWYAGAAELWAVRMRRGEIPGFANVGARAAEFRPPPPVRESAELDPSGARRPTSWGAPAAAKGPLSERDVAEIERYGGSLRNRGSGTDGR